MGSLRINVSVPSKLMVQLKLFLLGKRFDSQCIWQSKWKNQSPKRSKQWSCRIAAHIWNYKITNEVLKISYNPQRSKIWLVKVIVKQWNRNFMRVQTKQKTSLHCVLAKYVYICSRKIGQKFKIIQKFTVHVQKFL